MGNRPAQFVALAAALVLALPPGWCVGLCAHCSGSAHAKQAVARETAPVQHACCHRTKSQTPAASAALSFPAMACCCAAQARVTPDKLSLAPASDWQAITPAVALPLASVGLDFQSVFHESPVDPFYTGPPLRILQCVWRC